MIGYLKGKVLFSDGHESIILTADGIGHQVHFFKICIEGENIGVFISHVIRETSVDLYAFLTLREKKMFEMLMTVKGVGPKGAYSLVSSIGVVPIIQAIILEDKKTLSKAPGIGLKAASQMILDLSSKIKKIEMYNDTYGKNLENARSTLESGIEIEASMALESSGSGQELFENRNAQSTHLVLQDTLMACKELGFKEEKILPVAKKILDQHTVIRSEQLIHLVLKEL